MTSFSKPTQNDDRNASKGREEIATLQNESRTRRVALLVRFLCRNSVPSQVQLPITTNIYTLLQYRDKFLRSVTVVAAPSYGAAYVMCVCA